MIAAVPAQTHTSDLNDEHVCLPRVERELALVSLKSQTSIPGAKLISQTDVSLALQGEANGAPVVEIVRDLGSIKVSHLMVGDKGSVTTSVSGRASQNACEMVWFVEMNGASGEAVTATMTGLKSITGSSLLFIEYPTGATFKGDHDSIVLNPVSRKALLGAIANL